MFCLAYELMSMLSIVLYTFSVRLGKLKFELERSKFEFELSGNLTFFHLCMYLQYLAYAVVWFLRFEKHKNLSHMGLLEH